MREGKKEKRMRRKERRKENGEHTFKFPIFKSEHNKGQSSLAKKTLLNYFRVGCEEYRITKLPLGLTKAGTPCYSA